MGKRTATQTSSAATNKKAKLNPALSSVADAVKKSDHLPWGCRAMLIDLIQVTDMRLESHAQVVGMGIFAKNGVLGSGPMGPPFRGWAPLGSHGPHGNGLPSAPAGSIGCPNDAQQNAQIVQAITRP